MKMAADKHIVSLINTAAPPDGLPCADSFSAGLWDMAQCEKKIKDYSDSTKKPLMTLDKNPKLWNMTVTSSG